MTCSARWIGIYAHAGCMMIASRLHFGHCEAGRDLLKVRPCVRRKRGVKAALFGYDVRFERDESSVNNPRPRKTYRLELQDPNAWSLLEKLSGSPIEEIKFFRMGEIQIAGRKIRALAHAFVVTVA